MAGRKKLSKVKLTIKIDEKIYQVLENEKYPKSALINTLLSNFFFSQKSENSSQPSEVWGKGFEPSNLTNWSLKTTDEGQQNPEVGKNDKLFHFVWSKFKEKIDIDLHEKHSNKYADSLILYMNKLFQFKFNSVNEVRDIVSSGSKHSKKWMGVAFRNFIKYCEEFELLPEDIINESLRKIKVSYKSNIDSFVPSIIQIKKSLSEIKKSYPKYEVIYRIMLESGCRFSELKHFILNFDKSKVEVWDEDIVVYRNFYLRGKKSSYFLFCRLTTLNKLKPSRYTMTMLNTFQRKCQENPDIVCLKYIRKFSFTLSIQSNIPLEISNYLQGRSSQNLGFNVYLNKKLIAIREYRKYIDKLEELELL